jgi:hypothetical protein
MSTMRYSGRQLDNVGTLRHPLSPLVADVITTFDQKLAEKGKSG